MRNFCWLVVAAACMCACARGSQTERKPRSVYVTRPVELSDVSVKSFSGIVREAHSISLGFKTAGQITRIHVEQGDYVREGKLLAELDDVDYALGVEALQVQYDQLKAEVERTERLYEQKSVSANDYEKAVAGLRQLEVQLQVNKNKLEYTKLYAPTNGYIKSVNFSPAEMVDAGTAVFTLLDVSRMEVEVNIPASTYRQKDLFVGYTCKVAGETVPMKFLSLTPKADGNQLYNLRLLFADKSTDLTAGMNVDVEIGVKNASSAGEFALPPAAVFQDNGLSCVWVLGPDGCVTRRKVTTGGIDPEGRVKVNSGLSGNEDIVRAGVNALHEGDKVTVIDESASTNIGNLL